MGRAIKRVPLDFDAPKDETWEGYVMPDSLRGETCPACDGDGGSPRARELHALWYGHIPFKPEDNGSTPFTPETPEVRAFAERNVTRSPEFYGQGEWAIHQEASRLTDLWNSAWSHHLNAEDVAALVEGDRLWDLTRVYDPELGRRRPRDPAYMPTPDEVNRWSLGGMGHDAINSWIVVGARCDREGAEKECPTCGGHGNLETYPGQRDEAVAWERTQPQEGEGWQMWQTVSDAPLSPVFPTAEGLIEWMTTPDAKWGYMGPWSRENAEAFVHGPGWAPTVIGGLVPGLVVDGVSAVTR